MLKLLKSTIIYLGGNVLSKLVVFLMLPLYTMHFAPADYGYYDVANTYVGLSITIVFMEVWVIILRFMYDNKSCEKYKPMSNGVALCFICLLVLVSLIFIVHIFADIQYVGWVLTYACIIPINILYGYIARGFDKSLIYAISGVTAAVVNALASILLIVVFSVDYKTLYISYILGAFIQCAIIEWKVGVLRRFKLRAVNLEDVKKMFIFAIPFGLSSTGYWFLSSFNRTVISTQLSVADNGIYSVALKFTLVLTLLSSCFIYAWQEMAFKKGVEFEKKNKNEKSEFFSYAGNMFLKSINLAVLLLLPIIYILFPFIINEQYSFGFYIIPLAVIATMVNVYASFLTSIFVAIKKVKILYLDAIFGSIVNVIVVYSLINQIGLNASSIALICGWGTSATIRVALLNKYIDFKVDLKIVFGFLPLIVAGSFIYLYSTTLINVIWLFLICVSAIFIMRKEIKMIYLSYKSTLK